MVILSSMNDERKPNAYLQLQISKPLYLPPEGSEHLRKLYGGATTHEEAFDWLEGYLDYEQLEAVEALANEAFPLLVMASGDGLGHNVNDLPDGWGQEVTLLRD